MIIRELLLPEVKLTVSDQMFFQQDQVNAGDAVEDRRDEHLVVSFPYSNGGYLQLNYGENPNPQSPCLVPHHNPSVDVPKVLCSASFFFCSSNSAR